MQDAVTAADSLTANPKQALDDAAADSLTADPKQALDDAAAKADQSLNNYQRLGSYGERMT